MGFGLTATVDFSIPVPNTAGAGGPHASGDGLGQQRHLLCQTSTATDRSATIVRDTLSPRSPTSRRSGSSVERRPSRPMSQTIRPSESPRIRRILVCQAGGELHRSPSTPLVRGLHGRLDGGGLRRQWRRVVLFHVCRRPAGRDDVDHTSGSILPNNDPWSRSRRPTTMVFNPSGCTVPL
jgi:hypothetical protein